MNEKILQMCIIQFNVLVNRRDILEENGPEWTRCHSSDYLTTSLNSKVAISM